MSDVALALGDVFDQLVIFSPVIRDEQDVFAAVRELTERRDHRRRIAVADIIFFTVRDIGALGVGCEGHFCRINIGAVLPFGKTEGENSALVEKLGGQFNLAWLPPAKESLKEIIDFYIAELKRMGIDVINKEASKDDLLNHDYSGVILATGAEPVSPPIKGLSDYVWAEILYDQNMPKGEKVVVVGGGLIGIEIASKLVDNNNDVTIVEMLDEIARGMEMLERALTLKKLKSKNVKIYTGTKVEEINGKNVYIKGEKDSVLEGIDKIVIATGMKSFHPLEEELKDKIPVYIIGDAKEVGKAQEAISDGFTTTLEL